MLVLFFLLFLFLSIASYGFIDPNLTISSQEWVLTLIHPLFTIVYSQRILTGCIFAGSMLLAFFLFSRFFRHPERYFPSIRSLFASIVLLSLILAVSYPMTSYDLFNYMTTANVAFVHKENPYIVMPVEIANEANLSFTRAANKVALYGPVWILLTSVPHKLGMGNVWQTIIMFKLVNALWYIGFCLLIWRFTARIQNVVFFAFNPLVIMEVLVCGHNDIVMSVLAVLGICLWQKRQSIMRIAGIATFFLSILIKGATIVLVPLFFLKRLPKDRIFFIGSCLMLVVFIIGGPIREELYPWYGIWFISFAAMLPYASYSTFLQFAIVFSLGLELRHVPYMMMGYYEGWGPWFRGILTVLPVCIWAVWMMGKGKFFREK